tara:strand:- start:321 stop:587 length:267 start_codon:yes stop_codon:yes gene_type:complete
MSDKKYVGNGKQVGDYGMVNISIAASKVQPYWTEYKGEKYLRLSVGTLREANQYGQTHTVWIDEFVPEKKEGSAPVKTTARAGDGLPF